MRQDKWGGQVQVISDTLKGIVVLDFGQLVAAPVCGMWLADLGATVIKVEPPQGELARHLGPPSVNGESLVLLSSNRNKLGLSLDLKREGASAVLERMVKGADIILQNFRPGVADKIGLNWEELYKINPNLIYCAISAYGQDSAWRLRPGVDGIIQAASGMMSTILGVDGPGKVPMPLADMTAAMFAEISILSALRRRDAGAGGCFLDIDLFNSMMMLQQLNLSAYLTNGEQPEASGGAASYAAPNETFPTLDGWVMIAAYQPARWRAFCDVVGVPQIFDDPRFVSNPDRIANRVALHEVVDPIFRTLSSEEWTERLLARDVMASPVATYADVADSAAYRADKIEVSTHHRVAGEVRTPGWAFGEYGPDQKAAPELGQHSHDVMRLLQFSPQEIDNLVRDGIVIDGG